MTLGEDLLARIAEDEASATNWLRFEIRDGVPGNYAIPERVLAECEAKRRIVEHYLAWEQTPHQQGSAKYTEGEETMYRMAMRWVIEQMAQVWVDHPDYERP